MNVEIVAFPRTKVAAIEHHGSPAHEHDTARKLIAWKLAAPAGSLKTSELRHPLHRSPHDDRMTAPADHRVDLCLSIENDVAPNLLGAVAKVIPANRRARCRFSP